MSTISQSVNSTTTVSQPEESKLHKILAATESILSRRCNSIGWVFVALCIAGAAITTTALVPSPGGAIAIISVQCLGWYFIGAGLASLVGKIVLFGSTVRGFLRLGLGLGAIALLWLSAGQLWMVSVAGVLTFLIMEFLTRTVGTVTLLEIEEYWQEQKKCQQACQQACTPNGQP